MLYACGPQHPVCLDCANERLEERRETRRLKESLETCERDRVFFAVLTPGQVPRLGVSVRPIEEAVREWQAGNPGKQVLVFHTFNLGGFRIGQVAVDIAANLIEQWDAMADFDPSDLPGDEDDEDEDDCPNGGPE